jgi:hypothetical protein
MRKMSFATKSVDVSNYSDRHQRMINVAFGLVEFTLVPERTPIAIAEQSDTVSERLWEIALEERRPRLA